MATSNSYQLFFCFFLFIFTIIRNTIQLLILFNTKLSLFLMFKFTKYISLIKYKRVIIEIICIPYIVTLNEPQ